MKSIMFFSSIEKVQNVFDDMVALGFNAIIEKIGELYRLTITEKEQVHTV